RSRRRAQRGARRRGRRDRERADVRPRPPPARRRDGGAGRGHDERQQPRAKGRGRDAGRDRKQGSARGPEVGGDGRSGAGSAQDLRVAAGAVKATVALLPLSPQVFSILSALVTDHCGLTFDAAHMPVFAEKIAARAAEAGFESLLDYYYFLRYDAGGADELTALVETLVIGETYFFRELP